MAGAYPPQFDPESSPPYTWGLWQVSGIVLPDPTGEP